MYAKLIKIEQIMTKSIKSGKYDVFSLVFFVHTVFVHIFFFTNFVCQSKMTNKAFQILSWLRHALTATNTHGHGIHSPRLFNIVQNVIDNPYPYYIYKDIERYRKVLEQNNSTINVTDLGTGQSGPRTISHIARTSLADKKQAQLLNKIAAELEPNVILELGTSLGLTTAYLAAADYRSKVISLEGCPNIAEIARKTLDTLHISNASIIVGDISNTLDTALDDIESIGLLYIDANHTAAALEKYFDKCAKKMSGQAIAVVDDIYWSEDMNKGWRQLTHHPKVTTSFDLYNCGMLFFDTNLPHRTYRIRL